jgi:O-antigen/teichoic acid export membrane protein
MGPEQKIPEDLQRERQMSEPGALIPLAQRAAGTPELAQLSLPPPTRPHAKTIGPRILALFKDPALGGSAALMTSSTVSGVLALLFWSVTAHRQHASGLGSVSAEVSVIMFLAGMSSLNFISVFARFLPEAGRVARRFILTSYGGSAMLGLLAATIFFLTPMATRLVPAGNADRFAFTICVVLTSIFMIQDGGLVGFGRYGWVPFENILVALARLALLPVTAIFLAAPSGVLWSWALPMAIAVLVINVLIIGPLAERQKEQRSRLPKARELGRFIAVESVATVVSGAVATFLPALVTERLGSVQGGYFYVPWMIATMVVLPINSILISMVREAVARPEKADVTIRRSLGIVSLIVIVAIAACLLLSHLVLGLLGPDFVSHGAPLLRWVGLSVPGVAVNLLFWSMCLVRRRAWPVFAANLVTSSVLVAGVMSLGPGSDISSVGVIYCIVQWAVALGVLLPTIKALRVVREVKESQ